MTDEVRESEPSRWSALHVAMLVVAAVFLLGPLIVLVQRRLSEPAAVQPTPPPPVEVRTPELLDQSERLLRAERASEALPLLLTARRLSPDEASVHNNLCVAYGLLRQKTLAVESCKRAIELRPDFPLARNNLRWVSGLPDGGAQ